MTVAQRLGRFLLAPFKPTLRVVEVQEPKEGAAEQMVLTARDQARLKGCAPALITKVDQVLTALSAVGVTMFVTEGLRSTERQQALYAQGRTAPGDRVTNCDGVVLKSNHQAHDSDGFGHAVDLAFAGADPYAEAHPWTLYGLLAEQVGLKWGGRWTSPHDRPHVELP